MQLIRKSAPKTNDSKIDFCVVTQKSMYLNHDGCSSKTNTQKAIYVKIISFQNILLGRSGFACIRLYIGESTGLVQKSRTPGLRMGIKAE